MAPSGRIARGLAALLLAGTLACGGEDVAAEPVGEGGGDGTACRAGEILLADGSCDPAGLPSDLPCPPGALLVDGACQSAGIPPDGCATGFQHDGDGGCVAILPAEPCPSGQLAVPGETACHPVSPSCGSGTWGDIPVEADTQFVDASYAGADSDGTEARPWTTISDGVAAAADGAIVAIAAGTYPEDVHVEDKPVRLWGRCAERVHVDSQGVELAGITVFDGCDGSIVRDLSVTGSGWGVAVSGSQDVLLERIWIHQPGLRGFQIEGTLGVTSATIRDCLVEDARDAGLVVTGISAAEVEVEGLVLRGTMPASNGSHAPGVALFQRGDLTMRRSLITDNHSFGIVVDGSTLQLEGTVVRNTLVGDERGWGLYAAIDYETGHRSTATVQGAVFENNAEVAVLIEAADLDMAHTVIRDTQIGAFDRGIGLEVSYTLEHPEWANAQVRWSLLSHNRGQGLIVLGSEATVEGLWVRDTLHDPTGVVSRGIDISDSQAAGMRSTAVVRGSLVERSAQIGLLVSGSDATVETTRIRDGVSNQMGEYGRAIQVQQNLDSGERASATLRHLWLEHNVDMGVFVGGSDVTFEQSLVTSTTPNGLGKFGDGLAVLGSPGAEGHAVVHGVRVEQSARAGLSAFGAHLSVADTVLQCQTFDLNAEPFMDRPPLMDDLGGNVCGCPDATESCTAVSAGLEPPAP